MAIVTTATFGKARRPGVSSQAACPPLSFPRRKSVRVGGDGPACQPALQEAVEGESDHRWRIPRNAVHGVGRTGLHQRIVRGARQAYAASADLRESGDRIHQARQDALACNEFPPSVRVAPPLAAHAEVHERAGLRRRIAQVAGTTGAGLPRGEGTTELRQDSGRWDRVEVGLVGIATWMIQLERRRRREIGFRALSEAPPFDIPVQLFMEAIGLAGLGVLARRPAVRSGRTSLSSARSSAMPVDGIRGWGVLKTSRMAYAPSRMPVARRRTRKRTGRAPASRRPIIGRDGHYVTQRAEVKVSAALSNITHVCGTRSS
jgi:hypothetical protein